MMAKQEFPHTNLFKKLCAKNKEDQKDISNWGDLRKDGTIYKVIKTETRTTQFGEALVLFIVTQEGENFKVWAPAGLAKQLEEEGKKKKPRVCYFTSHGQKVNCNGHTSNVFEACFQK